MNIPTAAFVDGMLCLGGLLDEHVDAGLMTLFKKQKKEPAAGSPRTPKQPKSGVTNLVSGQRALKGGIVLAGFKALPTRARATSRPCQTQSGRRSDSGPCAKHC